MLLARPAPEGKADAIDTHVSGRARSSPRPPHHVEMPEKPQRRDRTARHSGTSQAQIQARKTPQRGEHPFVDVSPEDSRFSAVSSSAMAPRMKRVSGHCLKRVHEAAA